MYMYMYVRTSMYMYVCTPPPINQKEVGGEPVAARQNGCEKITRCEPHYCLRAALPWLSAALPWLRAARIRANRQTTDYRNSHQTTPIQNPSNSRRLHPSVRTEHPAAVKSLCELCHSTHTQWLMS